MEHAADSSIPEILEAEAAEGRWLFHEEESGPAVLWVCIRKVRPGFGRVRSLVFMLQGTVTGSSTHLNVGEGAPEKRHEVFSLT